MQPGLPTTARQNPSRLVPGWLELALLAPSLVPAIPADALL